MSRRFPSIVASMNQMNLGNSSRSGQPADPKVFRDGRAARPTDVFIAVMGVTGSGKSSFISLCCKKTAEIGHQLHACTTTVDVYAYDLSPQQTVYLIDTPGFDDTNRSDTEVLREIASWLTTSYSNKVLLHGIIYLHRITDIRMQGSAKKNLLMFKKLCGDNSLHKVILATTMWDKVGYPEAKVREKELIDTPEFWGYMVGKGSKVYRHNNTIDSARRIIEKLAYGNSRVTLDLQNQMVNEKRDLIETGAGKELESELIKERQKWARELKEVREQMAEAIRIKDREASEALQEVKEDYKSRMKRLEEQNKRLHVDSERLHNERIEKLEKAFAKQQREHAKELSELYEKNLELKRLELQNLEKKTKPVKVAQAAKTTSSAGSIPAPATSSNQNTELSLSLCGDNFGLDGPKHFYQNCMSTSAYEELKTVLNALCFFVCGTNSSWVYKYRTASGGYYVKWSGNIAKEYPFLYEKLEGELATRELNFLCLGPNRHFFSKWKGYNWWALPANIENKVHEVKSGNIKSIALGINDSYVILHGTNWSWDLKGSYKGLRAILKESTSAPKAVALNSQNDTDYLVLRGTLGYNLTGPLGNDLYETFLNWKKQNGI